MLQTSSLPGQNVANGSISLSANAFSVILSAIESLNTQKIPLSSGCVQTTQPVTSMIDNSNSFRFGKYFQISIL